MNNPINLFNYLYSLNFYFKLFAMYYLYILECADKTLYTGITVDLERRVKEHNSSRLGAQYTYSRRPVKIVYTKKYRNHSLALKAEMAIKKLSRDQKIKLVNC